MIEQLFADLLLLTDSKLELTLLAVLLLVVLHQLYYYLRYIRIGSVVSSTEELNKIESPSVSVVVCARNEKENLENYLHTLLNQDYPNYEVIVVNDGSEDDTEIILEHYAREYPNMYHTFVPRGARVISSKKLALTIGIKAAHHDYILLTDADCRPESRHWISEMMRAYDDSTELVLGLSPYFENDSLLSSVISYDTLFNGLQYIGMARAGHPYMGVGRNLSYRRSTFFSNNGFQGLLSERAGDDDLFVNKVANRHNTRVVYSQDSLTWSPPKRTWHDWLHQKRRHLSVSSYYHTRNKLRLCIEPITRGMMYVLLILSLICGGWIGCIGFILWLLRLFVQIGVINLAARRLGVSRFNLEVILYDIFLPLLTLYILATRPLYKQRLYW